MSRIREFENYYLLCGKPQEILAILANLSAVGYQMLRRTVRCTLWYSFQNFILKASYQSKIMKTIPTSVAHGAAA